MAVQLLVNRQLQVVSSFPHGNDLKSLSRPLICSQLITPVLFMLASVTDIHI